MIQLTHLNSQQKLKLSICTTNQLKIFKANNLSMYFQTFLIQHMDIKQSMMDTKINTIISNDKGINSKKNDMIQPA